MRSKGAQIVDEREPDPTPAMRDAIMNWEWGVRGDDDDVLLLGEEESPPRRMPVGGGVAWGPERSTESLRWSMGGLVIGGLLLVMLLSSLVVILFMVRGNKFT